MKYWSLFKEGFAWGVGFSVSILTIIVALRIAVIIHAA